MAWDTCSGVAVGDLLVRLTRFGSRGKFVWGDAPWLMYLRCCAAGGVGIERTHESGVSLRCEDRVY